jgi:phosphatidylglycerol:prolipoprotein diacylglycerol transferase
MFQIGPIKAYWYGFSYIVGIILAERYAKYLTKKFNFSISSKDLDLFMTWAIIGIILGGRLGYVLFYAPLQYLAKPIDIFKIYEGGMSFHGGLIGLVVAAYLFCKKHHIIFIKLCDLLSLIAPIGLFCGRIANFINAELWGRVTTVPWGVVFPGQTIPRHPSQIYEALTEGLLLFAIINIIFYKFELIKKNGYASALLLIFYAIFRSFCELYREPDIQIGFILNFITMGQLLSLCMLLAGFGLLYKYKVS